MYEAAPGVSSAPHVPFVMAPLVTLQRTLADTTLPIPPTMAAAVGTLSTHFAHLDLHVSSQSTPSPYRTYPVTSSGFRYGTISHAVAPPASVSLVVLHHEFQRLAAECGDLLQFLDLVQWQRWQRTQAAVPRQAAVTARERDILVHLAQGVPRSSLPHLLAIETGTVKKHLENLYRKLRVTSLSQALAVGRDAGLFRYLS